MAYREFLLDGEGEDFDGIRALLGVTKLDFLDELVDLPHFGPQAEFYVQRAVPEWPTVAADGAANGPFILRLASAYRTACLMAETWATGGTIGNVDPPDATRDWTKHAAALCAKAAEWIAAANAIAGDGTYVVVDPTLLLIAHGPSSTSHERAPWAPWPRPPQITP